MDEVGKGEKSERRKGIWEWIIRMILCLITLFGGLYCLGIHEYFGLIFFIEQYSAFILALILSAIFLSKRVTQNSKQSSPPWYDLILSMGGLIVGGYLMVKYPDIILFGGIVNPIHVVLGMITIVLVFEAVRRTVGWTLIILTAVMIFYALFSDIFPKVVNVKPIPWERLIHYLYTDNNALLGMPLTVTLNTVFPFLLFGTILFTLGGGDLLCNFALAIFGRFRGGPAKVAVVSSAFFGTISGSAVANVTVTGQVTIPLMKRVGYNPDTAAAIEAVASTGGQIMPPVMGLAAFLIADFLSIPYGQVALSAAIPAILYYICIFVQVDREAIKKNLKPLSKEEVPRVGPIIKEGVYFIVPFLILIYTLFILNLEAGKCGMWGALSIIGIGLLKKKTRNVLREKWMRILENTGRTVIELGGVVAIAGLVIGLFTVSGLSSILTIEIVRFTGENLLFLLILVAFASIILGMGLPTAACYILLALMIGPSMVKLGIRPLAAHLFILYFGLMSMVTPPVCLAVYAAAAIAGSSVMKTGFTAMRLGIMAYLIPFLFVFSPEFLLIGPIWKIVLTFVTAIIGVTLIGIGFVGYLASKINWITRILVIFGGAALIVPPGGGIPHSLLLNVVGGIVGMVVITISYLSYLLKRKLNSSKGPLVS